MKLQLYIVICLSLSDCALLSLILAPKPPSPLITTRLIDPHLHEAAKAERLEVSHRSANKRSRDFRTWGRECKTAALHRGGCGWELFSHSKIHLFLFVAHALHIIWFSYKYHVWSIIFGSVFYSYNC